MLLIILNKLNGKVLSEVSEAKVVIAEVAPGAGELVITIVVSEGAPSVSSIDSILSGQLPVSEDNESMGEKTTDMGSVNVGRGSNVVTPTKVKLGYVRFVNHKPVSYKENNLFLHFPDKHEGRLSQNQHKTL